MCSMALAVDGDIPPAAWGCGWSRGAAPVLGSSWGTEQHPGWAGSAGLLIPTRRCGPHRAEECQHGLACGWGQPCPS